jgi:hypothetical protein
MKRALIVLGLLAQPALAAQTGQAAFAPGTQVPARLVVGDVVWNCADGRCAGPAETRMVAMQRACSALARSVGAITSFTVGTATLAPDAVQACNTRAGRAHQAVAVR